MRATLMYGAADVRVQDLPDPAVQEPTDAVVSVLRAVVCGSDLWPYGSMPPAEQGRPMGHEFLGIVEDLGSEVSGLKAGDLVVASFLWLFVDRTSGRHAGMVDALAVSWPVELTRLFRRETRGAVWWIRRAGHRLDPVAAVGPGR